MRPSTFPKEWNNESLNTQNKSNVVTQLWRTNGRCPKNSIPIIRTRREDILREKSMRTYGKKEPNLSPSYKKKKKRNLTASLNLNQTINLEPSAHIRYIYLTFNHFQTHHNLFLNTYAYVYIALCIGYKRKVSWS